MADGPYSYSAGSTRSKLSVISRHQPPAAWQRHVGSRQCRPSEGVRLVPKSVGLARSAPPLTIPMDFLPQSGLEYFPKP
jgi:hypothetical protein